MDQVIEAIIELQSALGMQYNRHKLKISLEPGAFYCLSNEIQSKLVRADITPEQHDAAELTINGPFGEIKVVRDNTLGKYGYLPKYFTEE